MLLLNIYTEETGRVQESQSISPPGPILKGWTRNPRRVYAAMSPTAMEVLPTPLQVPATTMVLMLPFLLQLLPSRRYHHLTVLSTSIQAS